MTDVLALYRDDGPLTRLLAQRLRIGLGALPLAWLGTGAVVVGLLADLGRVGAGTVVGALVLVAACVVGAAAPPHPRLQWLAPPALRAGEYVLVIGLGLAAEGGELGAVYGLLAVLAFHHYDVVYRIRHQRVPPPPWLFAAGLGVELRVLVVVGAALAGALTTVLGILAVWCGLLFVGESVRSWVAVGRDEQRQMAMDVSIDEDAVDDEGDG